MSERPSEPDTETGVVESLLAEVAERVDGTLRSEPSGWLYAFPEFASELGEERDEGAWQARAIEGVMPRAMPSAWLLIVLRSAASCAPREMRVHVFVEAPPSMGAQRPLAAASIPASETDALRVLGFGITPTERGFVFSASAPVGRDFPARLLAPEAIERVLGCASTLLDSLEARARS